MGVMDSLIAAQAMAEHMTLVTHNTRHFERIHALPPMQSFKWVDWVSA